MLKTITNTNMDTPCQIIHRQSGLDKPLILLLHGYFQDNQFIYKKLIDVLPESATIVAINGPYPLLKNFPLNQDREDEDLIAGYAWYFYDAKKDQFLINYSVPTSFICDFLKKYNQNNSEVLAIGYSQGGYLIPFLMEGDTNIKHGVAINSSFRHDLMNSPSAIKGKVEAINGELDTIVDPSLAKLRLSKFPNTTYTEVKSQGHKLTKEYLAHVKNAIDRSPINF